MAKAKLHIRLLDSQSGALKLEFTLPESEKDLSALHGLLPSRGLKLETVGEAIEHFPTAIAAAKAIKFAVAPVPVVRAVPAAQ